MQKKKSCRKKSFAQRNILNLLFLRERQLLITDCAFISLAQLAMLFFLLCLVVSSAEAAVSTRDPFYQVRSSRFTFLGAPMSDWQVGVVSSASTFSGPFALDSSRAALFNIVTGQRMLPNSLNASSLAALGQDCLLLLGSDDHVSIWLVCSKAAVWCEFAADQCFAFPPFPEPARPRQLAFNQELVFVARGKGGLLALDVMTQTWSPVDGAWAANTSFSSVAAQGSVLASRNGGRSALEKRCSIVADGVALFQNTRK